MPTKLFERILREHIKDILYIEREMRKFDIFTEKRMEVLRAIMERHPKSIRMLADMLERDIKNVFEDLQILRNMDLIDFVKEGKCKRPVVKKRIIIINLG